MLRKPSEAPGPLANPLLAKLSAGRVDIVKSMQDKRAANTDLGADEEVIEQNTQEDEQDTEDTQEEEDDDEVREENDENEEQEDGEPDEEDESDEDEDEEVATFDDDDLVEVKVDGKLQQIPFKEVAAALSGREAIKTRLNEAMQLRGAAYELYETRNNQLLELETGLTAAINATKDALFKATIKKPDASLARSNPQGYALAIEAYEQEQAELRARQEVVRTALANVEKAKKTVMEQFEAQQRDLLVQEFPELKDPEKAKAFGATLHQIGGAYGFTATEIAQTRDVRLLKMASDVARLRAYEAVHGPLAAPQLGDVKKRKLQMSANEEQRGRKPKILRAAGAVAAKKAAVQKASTGVKAAREAAAANPTRSSIAALMAAKRNKRG